MEESKLKKESDLAKKEEEKENLINQNVSKRKETQYLA